MSPKPSGLPVKGHPGRGRDGSVPKRPLLQAGGVGYGGTHVPAAANFRHLRAASAEEQREVSGGQPAG